MHRVRRQGSRGRGYGSLLPPSRAHQSLVFFPSVLIHKHFALSRPVSILAALLHTGNPKLLAGVNITVIGAIATTDDSLESAISVVDRASSLRKRHPADRGGTIITEARLQLHIANLSSHPDIRLRITRDPHMTSVKTLVAGPPIMVRVNVPTARLGLPERLGGVAIGCYGDNCID
jgi:hypothetical protein